MWPKNRNRQCIPEDVPVHILWESNASLASGAAVLTMAEVSARALRAPAATSLLGNLALAWRYVLNESSKNKKNFLIGFTAVWLVVFSIVYEPISRRIAGGNPATKLFSSLWASEDLSTLLIRLLLSEMLTPSASFSSILQNTVTLAPILFLIIGETSTGEMDIVRLHRRSTRSYCLFRH